MSGKQIDRLIVRCETNEREDRLTLVKRGRQAVYGQIDLNVRKSDFTNGHNKKTERQAQVYSKVDITCQINMKEVFDFLCKKEISRQQTD